jgi:acyl-CoA thioester hydrolase
VPAFKFTTPVVVRYGDLDAQGHLNHARYFTFMEEARFRYLQVVGLWTDTHDFNAVGQIVAEATCNYTRPVFLGQTVDVAVRIARLGTKSLDMDYLLTVGGQEVARGRTVQVAYDYTAGRSIPIPAAWRQSIAAYEPDFALPAPPA